MDDMLTYEVDDYLDNIEYAEKVSWEQTRSICYLTAQVNSTKKLSPTDILKFKWDKNDDEEHVYEISTKDIERLKNIASKIENGNT